MADNVRAKGWRATAVRDRAWLSRVYDQSQNTRAAARPRQWRPPSGQSSAQPIAWIERSALHHPLHEPVNYDPQVFAGVGTNGTSVVPPWPAERTPAPPALTFVLPGKQRVKPAGPRADLARAVRGLPQICRVLGNLERPGRRRRRRYLCVRLTARATWSCRKSVKAMPCALSALGYSEALVRPGSVLVSR